MIKDFIEVIDKNDKKILLRASDIKCIGEADSSTDNKCYTHIITDIINVACKDTLESIKEQIIKVQQEDQGSGMQEKTIPTCATCKHMHMEKHVSWDKVSVRYICAHNDKIFDPYDSGVCSFYIERKNPEGDVK